MKELVKLARRAIEEWVKNGKKIEVEGGEKRGVFVTIMTYPDNELRGCIGFPFPVEPLKQAVVDAAIEATMDPRFSPLRKNELNKVTIEVTVLGEMKKLKGNRDSYPNQIKIGRDGLYIRSGFMSGILLPQVPLEYHWNSRKFLSEVCIKAGLPPDAWMSEDSEVYRFEGEIWKEKEPNGEVVREFLK